jgi:undecaprenyl-diphosphatase
MNALIVATAQYLPLLIPLAAAIIWFLLPRTDKFAMAAQALISLVVVLGLIQLAAGVHADPRPFVVDPSVKALFTHPPDNGFPSDHTALAATVALLVMIYRKFLGAVLLTASIVAGAARVAAHVHHVQDIVAGALIAVVAVELAVLIWRWARPRLPRRLAQLASA